MPEKFPVISFSAKDLVDFHLKSITLKEMNLHSP